MLLFDESLSPRLRNATRIAELPSEDHLIILDP